MATDANTTPGPRLARLALAGGAALLAAATSAGCHNNHDTAGATSHGERFPRDTDVRPVDRFAQVQSAAGARSDATLNGSHFDGRGGLNSLGRHKLDLMLRDDDAGPVVIYLDLSRPAAAARAAGASPAPFDVHRESVRVYLVDRGLDESQFEFRAGPNAGDTSPARDGLRGLTELHADSNGSAKSAPMTSRLGAANLTSPNK